MFFVSPVAPLRITPLPSYSTRAPPRGEALLLIERSGVLCRVSVGKNVADNVWEVEGCSGGRPVVVGAIAVRASEATEASLAETHWIGEPARTMSHKPVAPGDGGDSMWRPFTIVDLTGDRTKQVAVYCRRPATSEYECERFMVYRGNKNMWWFCSHSACTLDTQRHRVVSAGNAQCTTSNYCVPSTAPEVQPSAGRLLAL